MSKKLTALFWIVILVWACICLFVGHNVMMAWIFLGKTGFKEVFTL